MAFTYGYSSSELMCSTKKAVLHEAGELALKSGASERPSTKLGGVTPASASSEKVVCDEL